MHNNCTQQPRDIVVIDEEDPVKAVQPSQYPPKLVLPPKGLPRRDAHGLITARNPRQQEIISPPPYSHRERLSSISKKSAFSTSTERSYSFDSGAAYDNTGCRQSWISQDEPTWRSKSHSTHLPLYKPSIPEDEMGNRRYVPEELGREPLSHVTYEGSKDTVTIDLDTDDESEISASISAFVIEDDHQEQKGSRVSVPGLAVLEPIYETLERISSDNRTLKAGKTVELLDEDFLRIQSVVRDISTTEIFLRGHRLRRAKNLEGLLELKLNEVVMILEMEASDPRPVMVQGIEQVPLAQVGRIRELVVTNRPFPELSFRECAHKHFADGAIANYGRLVCRWKYMVSFQTLRDRRLNKYSERCLTRFQQCEIDSDCAVNDDLLRQHWRGDTVKGGACLDMAAEEEVFDAKEGVATQTSERIRPSQATGTGRKSSKTVTESSSSSQTLSAITSSSSLTGNLQHPHTVLDHKTEILPDRAAENRGQAARHQTVIDLTSDESSKLSLSPLSLDESRGRSYKRRCSHEDGTGSQDRSYKRRCSHEGRISLTSQHHTNQSLMIDESSTSDVTEVSAHATAKSTSGLYKTKYIGAVQSSYVPPLASTSYLNTASQRTTDFLSDTGRGRSRMPLSTEATTYSDLVVEQRYKQRTQSRQGLPPNGLRQKQRYTFGDAFCGAGGTSRGAKSAGFRVQWGFDFDFSAITSYSLNFYNADCIVAWAHQFAEIIVGDNHKVDVLHLSPPCQVFSWAHTVDGKDDEMNSATFFAVEELVKRIKPRVVTLENTSGLSALHPLWLNSAIHIFTKLGFSVRWKIMNFAEYGLVQARKRLIIIASCLGEGLPEFPKPTHGIHMNGLAPLVTVQDVISKIPHGFANHDPDSAGKRNEPPYPADQVLRACITCSGGGNYHPSGKRDFTLREYACLQGFPLEHKFGLTRVKKQIGNAVPPLFAKILFEEIKKTLLKADGF